MTSRRARGDRRAASKACPKQGVCPASRSSHTIPAHHPGRYHPTSGSPHPRGVLLISSRISRASPAGAARPRPVCTGSLTTPNGAPHRPRSRICALPFTGGGAGAYLRIVIHFYIYLHHTWSRTQTLWTPGALYGCLHGPVAQFRSKRLCSVQHAPLTRDQRQCGRAADCPAHWLATIKSRRRRASQLRLPLQRRPHGSLKKAAISR